MKKKIIFLAFCLILFLIFTTLSYGLSFDPRFHGHPWDDLLAPPANDTTIVNVLTVSIGPNTILTFILKRAISTTENINPSNINREKWIKAPKEFPKRLPQR